MAVQASVSKEARPAVLPTAPAEATLAGPIPSRNVAIDVHRGFVMSLMLAEVLHLPGLVKSFPGNPVAQFLSFNTSHVEWVGASLHDLIQPGFSFLVGAALAYSVAARRARGDTFGRMLMHAILRAIVLVSLGVILRSLNRPQTYFTFEDTLSQIGLGYVFLFLLAFVSMRTQLIALGVIVFGYWAAFMLYPAAGGDHFGKNVNLAWAFDTWFLNLFPREAPFVANRGGYSTLSFIPTLGTMLIGLLTGEWLRTARSNAEKLRGLLIAGVSLFAAGMLWHFSGLCPFVKRIWTPSWTLGSGGLVILMLSLFFWITDVKGWRKWAFPLLVVGSNSIVAYLMSWIFEAGLIAGLNRHLGQNFFLIFGPDFEAIFRGSFVLAIFWLTLYYMYKRKIFVRI